MACIRGLTVNRNSCQTEAISPMISAHNAHLMELLPCCFLFPQFWCKLYWQNVAHDGCAVVACAKLCSNPMASNWIKRKTWYSSNSDFGWNIVVDLCVSDWMPAEVSHNTAVSKTWLKARGLTQLTLWIPCLYPFQRYANVSLWLVIPI